MIRSSSDSELFVSLWLAAKFSNNDLKKFRALGVRATAALRGMNFFLRLLLFRALFRVFVVGAPPSNGDDNWNEVFVYERVTPNRDRGCCSLDGQDDTADEYGYSRRPRGRACRFGRGVGRSADAYTSAAATAGLPILADRRQMPCLERIIVNECCTASNEQADGIWGNGPNGRMPPLPDCRLLPGPPAHFSHISVWPSLRFASSCSADRCDAC